MFKHQTTSDKHRRLWEAHYWKNMFRICNPFGKTVHDLKFEPHVKQNFFEARK